MDKNYAKMSPPPPKKKILFLLNDIRVIPRKSVQNIRIFRISLDKEDYVMGKSGS